MDAMEQALRASVHDGILLGMSMAIDLLTSAKPAVAIENQTWDSAISVIAIARVEYQAKAIATPSGKEGGE